MDDNRKENDRSYMYGLAMGFVTEYGYKLWIWCLQIVEEVFRVVWCLVVGCAKDCVVDDCEHGGGARMHQWPSGHLEPGPKQYCQQKQQKQDIYCLWQLGLNSIRTKAMQYDVMSCANGQDPHLLLPNFLGNLHNYLQLCVRRPHPSLQ
jgi:hypothetical protein